jgi:hypothetical protein
LEKLTEGEAAKVISTVKDENGFEAWRQLHLRFEPELEAQKNVVLVDLHNIAAATTVEETKSKMVELRVRITKAENILGVEIQEIQKKTALLQIIDPTTRQHTARVKGNFDEFYAATMNFANTVGVATGASSETHPVSAVKEQSDNEHDEYDTEGINGLGKGKGGKGGCRICGDLNHWQRECPHNAGKGKGYSGYPYTPYPPKGKGKSGKGPCYNCGEVGHYSRECPRPKGGGKSKGMDTGGKKGYGKGDYGSKGKGQGWVNGISDQWGAGYADDWGSNWSGADEYFCGSLKTVIPDKTTNDEEWQRPKRTPCRRDWAEKLVTSKAMASSTTNRNKYEALNENNEKAGYDEDVEWQACGQHGKIDCEHCWCEEIKEEANKYKEERDINSQVQIIATSKATKKKDKMMRVGKWKKLPVESSNPAQEIFNKFDMTFFNEKPGKKQGKEEVARACDIDAINNMETMFTKMKTEMTLNPIKTIEPNNLNNISEDGVWEEIELAVDSGATESVVPSTLPASIPTVDGPASKRGVLYEVASGHQIPNEGEKRFSAVTEEGKEKKLVLQVCDVNQGLLSVAKMMTAGNRVVFDPSGSYVESKTTGDRTWLKERGGMFIMKLWVRRPF